MSPAAWGQALRLYGVMPQGGVLGGWGPGRRCTDWEEGTLLAVAQVCGLLPLLQGKGRQTRVSVRPG